MLICKKLIDVAKEAGCDAVKFQKRDLEKVYTEEFLTRQEKVNGAQPSEIKKGLEFKLTNTKK